LCIIAILMVLAMLRLGVWQLDRAEQKHDIVVQLESRMQQAAAPISEIFELTDAEDVRFRKVLLTGRYLQNNDFYVDNQVVNGQVGYQVFTPFRVDGSATLVMVARGWVSVGESRQILPNVVTDPAQLALAGRLNAAPAQPPLWDEKYSVSDGKVWQYLPMPMVEDALNAKLFPLVVELTADASEGSGLVRQWPEIDDKQVARHQGYAFQWFSMAVAFFIACLVLLFRSFRKK
jgi:surfeit locus 1 family protein